MKHAMHACMHACMPSSTKNPLETFGEMLREKQHVTSTPHSAAPPRGLGASTSPLVSLGFADLTGGEDIRVGLGASGPALVTNSWETHMAWAPWRMFLYKNRGFPTSM